LYAYALIHAVPERDISLFVDPGELSLRLDVSMHELDTHFHILGRKSLVTEWSADEAEMAGRSFLRRHFYLRGLDNEDRGAHFLFLLHKRFARTPPILVDILENLNFGLLDGDA
jgi:hypothetical protein